MLTDKANILAKNAKRARVVRPNNNFGEGRIRPAKDDGSASAMHELKRGVVIKQHGSDFPVGDILLPIHDSDVSGKNSDVLHAVAFYSKCEQVRASEKLRRYRQNFIGILKCLTWRTRRDAPYDRNSSWWHIHDQFQTARLARQ